ncbi:putative RNA-directed RNA polymerase [Helianthus annuus]|nr:putative RNA-directed RNA polymerase [Helianthus annuus]KAJ0567698.1 putative RNA-directed RNA polymerase [Helianthus annuus]KAJ0916145.1 putative RNA-directed RNA polymerase [Helianthus annuus]
MGSEGNDRELVVSQVSIGGFGNEVTAKMLLDYLESTHGQIYRCRLKKSSTPPETYPEFNADLDQIKIVTDYEKVEPHAFVHFVDPNSVTSVLEAAGRKELVLDKHVLKVSLGPENPYRMNQRRRKKTSFKLSNVVLEIGLMTSRDDFVVGWRGPDSGVDFLIDPFDRSCKFLLTKDTAFCFKGTKDHAVIRCNYKVEFLVRDVNDIKEYTDYSESCLVLVFQLASSPLISYRTADDDIINTYPFEMLDDDDPWIRTTDFTPSGAIGRCNTYRVMIRIRDGSKVKKALEFLEEQRVHVEHRKTKLKAENEPEFGFPIPDPFFSIHYKPDISFKVMFLVNSVLHRCIINQHQFTENVFDLLRDQSEEVNVAALKHICAYRHPLYDGFKRLKTVQEWLLNTPKRIEKPLEQNDVIEVGRLIITPTKAYALPPEVELSNRVLRHYRQVSDRFLRVTFMDEGMRTLNNNVLNFYPAPIVKDVTSTFMAQKTTMFRRVKDILSNGFHLSGRQYCFLAFSANQLRDRSAWFFAENGKISCKNIIAWMGRFNNKNIAKCAARMGQCFSSTYATVDVPRHEVNMKLEDIKRNNYTFSDGIGKISPELALEVAEKLQLTDNQPCAYQIRYAGCKGVVACWPNKEGENFKLSLRRSMNKFESDHTVLEICSWTRLQPGFLNRQIITLLSALDVKDEIFWDMQMKMVEKLNLMLENTEVAFDVITASCAESGNTASIMLGSGFDPKTEPHLRGMLSSIRVAQLEDLREKSRIFVNDGRWLMGCFDELGVLEQGQCFIQVSNPSVENCFAKHGSRFSETTSNLTVIEGTVIIAKNPCLHPGDVRVLKAVNVPGLEHLFDCLIFPQKGDRPHTDEASGSDLDGDLYFVTWDENLIPPSKRSWPPMEYTAAEAKELTRDVRTADIVDFFTKNMVNDSLGTICNAHVVHADLSDDGALDEKCLKLAELAATAVDFPKTGKIVNMPAQLKPKQYPDFMGKENFQSYKSEKILGKLYRQIKDFYNSDNNTPCSELEILPSGIPYDEDLEVPDSASFLNDAWDCKLKYDLQLNGLLGQYKVSREEEIVTGHIWSMPKHGSKKQGEMKDRIKHAYSALRKEFRKVFDQLGVDFDQISEEERNAVFEKKASAWYQVTYHPIWVKKSLKLQEPDREGETVNLSFAWIAADYLARIKIKRKGAGPGNSHKPIDMLGRYIADRI